MRFKGRLGCFKVQPKKLKLPLESHKLRRDRLEAVVDGGVVRKCGKRPPAGEEPLFGRKDKPPAQHLLSVLLVARLRSDALDGRRGEDAQHHRRKLQRVRLIHLKNAVR